MDYTEEKKEIISSAKLALKELKKLITQNIDLNELDPEKAKAAAQGKIEAVKGSFEILELIKKEEDESNKQDNREGEEEVSPGGGVSSRLRD